MNVDAFVSARRNRWSELEARSATLTAGRLRHLGPTDLERLAALYRHAAGDLAIARRDFPDHPITEYLNGLCGRVHVLLHRGREPRVEGALQFFLTGAPRLFRANAGYFAAALACLLAGVLAGWLAYDLRPDLRPLLVPDSLFDEMARGAPSVAVPQPFLAAPSIFVHNIEVAAIVFVSGILLGLPTVYLLLLNGWTLGTLGAAVHGGGYDFAFWSLIAAHGVLELSIIVIAGAAGLRLGDAILRPGLRRRVRFDRGRGPRCGGPLPGHRRAPRRGGLSRGLRLAERFAGRREGRHRPGRGQRLLHLAGAGRAHTPDILAATVGGGGRGRHLPRIERTRNMAREVVVGGEVFKWRNPIGVWLGLPLITLGIYFFVWWYKINNEARRYLRDPSIRPGVSLLAVLLGWILIVPPLVSVYTTAQRVRRMQDAANLSGDRCNPWIALLLRFVFGLDVLYLQTSLNQIWEAHLRLGQLPSPAFPPQGFPAPPSPRGDPPPAPPSPPPLPPANSRL